MAWALLNVKSKSGRSFFHKVKASDALDHARQVYFTMGHINVARIMLVTECGEHSLVFRAYGPGSYSHESPQY